MAITGVVLVAASFPLAAEGDHRYEAYLAETDVTQIENRFQPRSRGQLRESSFARGRVAAGHRGLDGFVHHSGESRRVRARHMSSGSPWM
jgi:hypothetical protein